MSEVDVAVIGAGWAGLAAAVELVDAGAAVTLLDAAPRPGGRARAQALQAGGQTVELDNGQHLLVGAYRETLRLVDKVCGDATQVLRRAPMRLTATDGLDLAPPAWPAPWHLLAGLLRARGLTLAERLAMVTLMARLQLSGWRVPPGETVARLLDRLHQPASLVQRLWEPLCVATLNTRLQDACAATFCAVLRDTLGGRRQDSDFLLPRTTLGAVFPDPASQWLAQRGARLCWRTAVTRVARPAGSGNTAGAGWQLDCAGQSLVARQVVMAVPPVNAARLLAGVIDAGSIAVLESFDYEPIATAYLFWPASGGPALPAWTMLTEQPDQQAYGQWLFDRGELAGMRCAAVVISARGRQWAAAGAGHDDPGAALGRQVSRQLGIAEPAHTRLIIDKRATLRCTPTRPRLQADWLATQAPGLWLAGDYLWPDYPATLESAMRSGVAAARACSHPM